MTELKKRFLDGVAAPSSEALHLGDAEFIDIANNVFAFDGAVVLSSALYISERCVDFRLNYIASLGPGDLKWRKLRLHFGGIDAIVFGYGDVELGFPHKVNRQVDLDYAVRNQPSLFPKLESLLWRDHSGAELVEIGFEKFLSPLDQLLGKKPPSEVVRAEFVWEMLGGERDRLRILLEKVECREIEIEFLTPAADKPWAE